MSKRVKVSDLEVTERSTLLIYVNPPEVPPWSDKEQRLPMLHICTREGGRETSPLYRDLFNITNCNRPMSHPRLYVGKTLDLDNYRLCPRCALKDKTLETFEAKLAEYWEWRKQRDERSKQRKAKREAQDRAKRQAEAKRLDEFVSLAIADMPRERVWNALRFKHNGHTYEIKEIE